MSKALNVRFKASICTMKKNLGVIVKVRFQHSSRESGRYPRELRHYKLKHGCPAYQTSVIFKWLYCKCMLHVGIVIIIRIASLKSHSSCLLFAVIVLLFMLVSWSKFRFDGNPVFCHILQFFKALFGGAFVVLSMKRFHVGMFCSIRTL